MLKAIKTLFAGKQTTLEKSLLPILNFEFGRKAARDVCSHALDVCTRELDRLALDPEADCVLSAQQEVELFMRTALADIFDKYDFDHFAGRLRPVIAAAINGVAAERGLLRTFESSGALCGLGKIKLVAGKNSILIRLDGAGGDAADAIVTRLPWGDSNELEEFCRVLLEKPPAVSSGPNRWIGDRERSPFFMVNRHHPGDDLRPLLFLGVFNRVDFDAFERVHAFGPGVWLDRAEVATLRAFLSGQRRRYLGDPDEASRELAEAITAAWRS